MATKRRAARHGRARALTVGVVVTSVMALAPPVGADTVVATVTVTEFPLGLVTNPISNKTYVGSETAVPDPTAHMIDGATSTATLLPTIATPQTAWAVNTVTDTIYATAQEDDGLTVIDGATDTVVTTIAVGDRPHGVAVDPETNTIYVTNLDSDDVSVIDGDTNTVVETIPVGTQPNSIVVNPLTQMVYVLDTTSGWLWVIDGATNTVDTTIPLGAGGFSLAVNPVTDTVYVGNFFSSTLNIVDGDTLAQTQVLLPHTSQGVAVNPVTDTIFVSGMVADQLSIVDGATETIESTIAVGDAPYSVVVNPSTNTAYTYNWVSDDVSVIDGDTNTLIDTVIGDDTPGRLAVNPVTNLLTTANSSVGTADVIDGSDNTTPTAVPIETVVTPLSGDDTTSDTPTFTLTATSTWPLPVNGVYFRVDDMSGPWSAATPAGGDEYTLTTPTLDDGEHTIYAFATDAQASTSTSSDRNASPLVGAITSYTFDVDTSPPSPPPSEEEEEEEIPPPYLRRLAGPDASATAAAVSRATFAPGGPVVYVANRDAWPDSLLAATTGAPVLLVDLDRIPDSTRTEPRLDADEVVVVGGTAVVSDAIVDELSARRSAGLDRYGTSVAMTEEWPSRVDDVHVALGSSVADVLVAAAGAGAADGPMLLLDGNGIRPDAATALGDLDPDDITVVGGTAAIDEDTEDELRSVASVTRLAGLDRYATAAAVALALHDAGGDVVVVIGERATDAAAALTVAKATESSVLLTFASLLPDVTGDALEELAPVSITVVGGTAAVSEDVERELMTYL